MNPKYIVLPGWVYSKNDGDRHFISGEQLIRLYGVNPKECLIVREGQEVGRFRQADQIILEPDYSGEYKLPLEPWQEQGREEKEHE